MVTILFYATVGFVFADESTNVRVFVGLVNKYRSLLFQLQLPHVKKHKPIQRFMIRLIIYQVLVKYLLSCFFAHTFSTLLTDREKIILKAENACTTF